MNRRQFLAMSAATAATAAPGKAEERSKMTPIVDTHQHLWDLTKFKLGWVKDGDPLARSFVMDDYQKATEGLNVVKTVYMEVDVVPERQQAEADYVTEICRGGKTPMAAAVVSGRPGTEGFARYAAQFKGSKYVKGVRRVLHVPETPAGTCLGKEFVRDVRLLGDLGLSFDLCARAAELPDMEKLVGECPDTRFILDHCGNAKVEERGKERERWRKDMAAIARRKNLVCKVSGIVASAKPGEWTADDLAPIVGHTLEVFGPDRVMFGGDWPVCTLAATYRQWVEALKAIVKERAAAEQKKLFHDNAVNFYGLG
jgi:predicted TIM-barrel fold metal-dependent hydrolase